jgi:hypothetical protein
LLLTQFQPSMFPPTMPPAGIASSTHTMSLPGGGVGVGVAVGVGVGVAVGVGVGVAVGVGVGVGELANVIDRSTNSGIVPLLLSTVIELPSGSVKV